MSQQAPKGNSFGGVKRWMWDVSFSFRGGFGWCGGVSVSYEKEFDSTTQSNFKDV